MKLLDLFLNKPDFDTIEGINRIKIPTYKPIAGLQSPASNIEYILQRKATEHKKNGRMDLAIACLRKSNEIMRRSNFKYSIADYLRLPSYLALNGQKEEAIQVLMEFERWDISRTDRARLYAHIGAFLDKEDRSTEAVFYRAAGYIYTAINLNNLHDIAVKNRHSKAEIRSLENLIKDHKCSSKKAFSDLRPDVTAFIINYPLEGFKESSFRNKLNQILLKKG